MDLLRQLALTLRLAGKSYNEIHTELGIPKSTLSGWLKHVVLSDVARARLSARVHQGVRNGLVKRNKMQTHKARQRKTTIQNSAKREIQNLTLEQLRLVGAALYWAEGYKRAKVHDGRERTWHAIRFVNSDPDMVALFIRFLREVMDIPPDRIRLTMRLYEHINEGAAKLYWMDVTALSASQFCRTTHLVSISSRGRRPYNRLPWGTLQIEVCNTNEFYRLMGWIEGMKSQG